MLERLNAATQELIGAETERITDRVALLMREIVDVEYAAFWRYDDQSGDLEEHAVDAVGDVDIEAVEFPIEITDWVWETFVGADFAVTNDLDGSEATSPLESLAFVPLGRHGVVCLGATGPASFDERVVDLVETVAATIETTWDRAESKQKLAEQNEELIRLGRLNTLIREIDQTLVEADTSEEVNEDVCERLAESALYEFAWIGDFDADADAVRPRARAGVNSAALEELTTERDDADPDQDPFSTAIQTREMQVVADIATDMRATPWREVALRCGARSCLSIPLVYDDSVYGVLVVYGGTPQRDERESDMLAELGSTIAHAINAVETRETLSTNNVVELTLRTTEATTPLCRFARRLECPIKFEGLVPSTGHDATVFFSVSDASVADVLVAGDQSLALEDLTCLVDDEEEGALFRARVIEPTLASLFVNENTVVRSLSIDQNGATGVVDVFRADRVSELVNQLRESVPDLELLARRTQSRPLKTQQTFRQTFENRLTPRQQEVLHMAYRSGFFQSPRVQTGKELAATLGISPATFTLHLRKAERKLCEMTFEST